MEDGSAEQLWVPRALWWGVEWSRYALETMWKLDPSPPILRGYNVQARFDERMRNLPKALYKKLKYYRAHLATDLDGVRLRGYYSGTELDGQKDVYRDFMHAHTAACAELAVPPPAPEAFAGRPMRFYDAQTMLRVGMKRPEAE